MTLHVRPEPACLWKRGRDVGAELCDLSELGVTYMVRDTNYGCSPLCNGDVMYIFALWI